MGVLTQSGFALVHQYLLQEAVNVCLEGSPLLGKLNDLGNVHVQEYGSGIDWMVNYAENSNAGPVTSEGGTITDGTPAKAKAAMTSQTYGVKWSYTKKLKRAIEKDPLLAFYDISEETKLAYSSLVKSISEHVINGSGSSGQLCGFATALSAATGTYAGIDRANAWWQPYVNDDVSNRDLDIDLLNDCYDTIFNYDFVGPNRYLVTATQQFSNIKALGSAQQRTNNPAGSPAGISLGANPNEAWFNDIPIWFINSNQGTHPLLNSFYFLDLAEHHVYFMPGPEMDAEQVSNVNAQYVFEGTVEVCYVIKKVRGQAFLGHINN